MAAPLPPGRRRITSLRSGDIGSDEEDGNEDDHDDEDDEDNGMGDDASSSDAGVLAILAYFFHIRYRRGLRLREGKREGGPGAPIIRIAP